MKMKKSIRYLIRIKGENASFCATGYSRFYIRLSLQDKRRLRGNVYGIAQCKAHIAELRKSRYNGKLHLKSAVFEIVRVTTIERIVKTLS